MSISNYEELKTAVANWLHRSDLTARIPEFIQIGEGVLNRKLRTVDMETIATATLPTDNRFIAMPTGFLEMMAVTNVTTQTEFVYIEPSLFRDYIVTGSGVPLHYTVQDQIELDVIPSTADTIESRYFKKYDIATDSTNWLLTNYPELYLHASLSSAAFFVENDTRLGTIKNLLSEGIMELNDSESRRRGVHLAYARMDDGLIQRSRYNINKGY